MPPIYEQVLQKIGLDDKEAKIYLAALTLRSAPASEIARESGIPRTTTYGILEELVRKGLAAKTEKSGVIYFISENPELLKTYIESQKSNLDLISREIQAVLPDLKSLPKEAEFKPQVEYFEGVAGIKTAFESVMPDIKKMAKNKVPLMVHGTTLSLLKAWPEFPKYAAKRMKTGIEVRMLIWDREIPEPMVEVQKKYKIRFLPPKYAYPAGTNILDEAILFVDLENYFTVIIKNKRLAQMMRIFFEFMWDHSK